MDNIGKELLINTAQDSCNITQSINKKIFRDTSNWQSGTTALVPR